MSTVIKLSGATRAAPTTTGYTVFRCWDDRGIERRQLAASFKDYQRDEAYEYAEQKNQNAPASMWYSVEEDTDHG